MRLNCLDQQQLAWILGGDFNLLPPGQSARLSREARGIHSEPTEICSIYERYPGVPTVAEATGSICDNASLSHSDLAQTVCQSEHSITFRSTKSHCRKICRTAGRHEELSDHLPLIGEFTIPA